jgi:hypothetical protein
MGISVDDQKFTERLRRGSTRQFSDDELHVMRANCIQPASIEQVRRFGKFEEQRAQRLTRFWHLCAVAVVEGDVEFFRHVADCISAKRSKQATQAGPMKPIASSQAATFYAYFSVLRTLDGRSPSWRQVCDALPLPRNEPTDSRRRQIERECKRLNLPLFKKR